MTQGISVCIPAYENPSKLRRALASVAMQTHPSFETIVTDDSATDSVERVVEEFGGQLSVRYLRNRPSLGVPGNWNHAVGLARYELIKVLHHDDWFLERDSLETYARILSEHPEADFAFSATSVVRVSGEVERVHRPTVQQLDALRKSPLSLFYGNFVGAPSATVFRKRDDLLFDEKLVWDVDWEFYVNCLGSSTTGEFVYVDRALIATETGDSGSMTQSCLKDPELRVRERIHVYQKHARGRADSAKYLMELSALAAKLGIVGQARLQTIGASPQLSEYISRRGRWNLWANCGRKLKGRILRGLGCS